MTENDKTIGESITFTMFLIFLASAIFWCVELLAIIDYMQCVLVLSYWTDYLHFVNLVLTPVILISSAVL